MRIRCMLGLLIGVPGAVVGQQPTAVVSGRLVTGDGAAVAGGQVSLSSPTSTVLSDSSGRFSFSAVPAGRLVLRARALGFAVADTSLIIEPGERYSITLRLTRTAQRLDTVTTRAALPYGRPMRYANTGRFDDFYERRAKRPGSFFTREHIEQSGRSMVTDLLATVPGIRIEQRFDGPYVRIARCTGTSLKLGQRPGPGRLSDQYTFLAVFIDGQRVTDGPQTLTALQASDVETVEFYRGASQLPPEAVGDACAAIFITTRYTVGSVTQR